MSYLIVAFGEREPHLLFIGLAAQQQTLASVMAIQTVYVISEEYWNQCWILLYAQFLH